MKTRDIPILIVTMALIAIIALCALGRVSAKAMVASVTAPPIGRALIHSTAWSNWMATNVAAVKSLPPAPIPWRIWLAPSNTPYICVIQRTTDFAQWMDVASFAGSNMLYVWTDPHPPAVAAFYRVANYGPGYPIILTPPPK